MLTGCLVTMFHLPPVGRGKGNGRGRSEHPKCGEPVVKYGLCARHYADRMRLGGTA